MDCKPSQPCFKFLLPEASMSLNGPNIKFLRGVGGTLSIFTCQYCYSPHFWASIRQNPFGVFFNYNVKDQSWGVLQFQSHPSKWCCNAYFREMKEKRFKYTRLSYLYKQRNMRVEIKFSRRSTDEKTCCTVI